MSATQRDGGTSGGRQPRPSPELEIFVSDGIGAELRRIIEFRKGQMTDTTVLAIEVKQYVDEAGTQQTIVPRVVGQTQQARQAKGPRLPEVPGRDDITAAQRRTFSPDAGRDDHREMDLLEEPCDLAAPNKGAGATGPPAPQQIRCFTVAK